MLQRRWGGRNHRRNARRRRRRSSPLAREDPRTPGNDGQVDPPPQEEKAAQHAQLRELRAKLDEDRERLIELELILEQDQPYPHCGGARRWAQEVHRQIVGDGEPE